MPKVYRKTCEYCGKEYHATHKLQKHCSKVCSGKSRGSIKYQVKYCPVCEGAFTSSNPSQRMCSRACVGKATTVRKQTTCKNCGKHYMPKQSDRVTFCSRECAFDWKQKLSKEKLFYRELAAVAKQRRKYKTKCIVCQVEYDATSLVRRTCSDACGKVYARVVTEILYKKNRDKIPCEICGSRFYSYQGSKRCDPCREENKRRVRKAAKRTRKNRLKQATQRQPYTFKVVAERDGHACQYCGCSVSKEYDVNHDYYPNIDHIIPLSKGGADSLENVQLLCRKCNMDKADTVVDLSFILDRGYRQSSGNQIL